MRTILPGASPVAIALSSLLLATCARAPEAVGVDEVASSEAAVGYGTTYEGQLHDFAVDQTLSQFPNVKKGVKWAKNAKNVADHIRDYRRCVAEGKDQDGCKAKLVRWGVCWLVNWGVGKLMAPEFAMLGLPIEKLCNGEPTLKCCRYSIEPVGQCHSAFNTARPINCEGNPLGAVSFGVCAPREAYEGDIGCYCDYLPECAGGAVRDMATAPGWRVANLAQKLAEAVPIAIEGDATHPADPQGFTDFVTLTGCAAHRAFLADREPFGIPAPLPVVTGLPTSYTDAIAPDAALMRDMVTVAVRRVLAGIPNGIARWNAIQSRHFTDAERATYLARVADPAAVLGRVLGPFGLKLLQLAHPVLWPLLAVPLESEPANANEAWAYVGACVPGSAPVVTLSPTVSGAVVSVRVDVQDPREDSDDLRMNPMVIDWGDGRVDQLVRFVDDATTHVATHTYRTTGARAVNVRVVNAAGLTGEATANVSVTAAVADAFTDDALAVDTIALELDAVVAAQIHGYVAVDVAVIESNGEAHAAGRLFRKPATAPAPFSEATFALREALPNSTESSVAGLRLVPMHFGVYSPSRTVLRLGVIRFGRADGTTREWRPTLNDVQVFAPGASTPQAPTLAAGGMLEMPLKSAEIVLRVPAVVRDAWCRPSYAGAPPAFRNALGGCQDAQTGLVWSAPSNPISWHDAVWDSLLTGNAAKDAGDGTRTADYATRPAGPDASLTNYCHELTQGGFNDWRLPTDAEVVAASGAAKAGAFVATSGRVWTSNSWTEDYAVVRDLLTGDRSFTKKVDPERAVCVRSPTTTTLASPGAPCSADAACEGGHCVDGVCCNEACGGPATNDCLACSVAAGAVADGICSPLHARACDDGRRCSSASSCTFGACLPTTWVACAAGSTACEAGAICDASTGLCRPIPVADGTACDDANACTSADACVAGDCTAGAPITCDPAPACQIQDACRPAVGACPALRPEEDGTACDDGNPCTQVDSCHAGACGSAPVTCVAADACHDPGACDPSTGACSSPAKADGSACPGGQCVDGSCVTSTIDGGATDAGSLDSGMSDAGASEVGSGDGGGVDASTLDSGASDPGASDPGASDAAVTGADLPAGDAPADTGGCGCDATVPSVLAFVALVPGLRRRRFPR